MGVPRSGAQPPRRPAARRARVHWPGGGSCVALSIEPVTRPFDAVVELPGSKSYTNRALLIAALARGRSEITEALSSDDTHYMHRALEALGVRIEDRDEHTFLVDGVDGVFPASEATLQ